MGYRSDVGIMVNEKHLKEFSKVIEPLIESADEIFENDRNVVKGVYFEWIKWDEYFDPEIMAIEEFIKSLPYDDYGFIVIGEDNSDIKVEGLPQKYGLRFIRKIEIDCQIVINGKELENKQ